MCVIHTVDTIVSLSVYLLLIAGVLEVYCIEMQWKSPWQQPLHFHIIFVLMC